MQHCSSYFIFSRLCMFLVLIHMPSLILEMKGKDVAIRYMPPFGLYDLYLLGYDIIFYMC